MNLFVGSIMDMLSFPVIKRFRHEKAPVLIKLLDQDGCSLREAQYADDRKD